MEWLAENLTLAYPLGDQVTDPLASIIADGFVVAPFQGIFTLTIFDPQALTNAHVKVQQGATVILETTSATVTELNEFTMMEGIDVARDSRYRFIVSTEAIQTYALLTEPIELAPNACVTINPTVETLNGLDGDVELTFDKFISETQTGGVLELAAQEPVDRVDCSTVDCDKVFTLTGISPDDVGSFAFANDGCHRIVPHPTEPNKLLIFNLCTPCLDCDDIDALNERFGNQAEYLYQLAAIHHDQFNRYQEDLVAANRQTEAVEAAVGTFSHTCGMVQVSGRSFNRPYFSQLIMAVTNSSTYHLSVQITATISPVDLAGLVAPVPGGSIVQRFGPEGATQSLHSGFPGVVTFTVGPGETVSISSEVHQGIIDDSVAQTGQWHVGTQVTYTGGCATLPAAQTVNRTFSISFAPADPAFETP